MQIGLSLSDKQKQKSLAQARLFYTREIKLKIILNIPDEYLQNMSKEHKTLLFQEMHAQEVFLKNNLGEKCSVKFQNDEPIKIDPMFSG